MTKKAKNNVKLIWLLKAKKAFSLLFAPRDLETIEPPPIPMDIPIDENKKEIGKTTEIAPIARSPFGIYWPTKNVSTTMLSDITIKPTAAGIACLNNRLFIGAVPSIIEFSLELLKVDFRYYMH